MNFKNKEIFVAPLYNDAFHTPRSHYIVFGVQLRFNNFEILAVLIIQNLGMAGLVIMQTFHILNLFKLKIADHFT